MILPSINNINTRNNFPVLCDNESSEDLKMKVVKYIVLKRIYKDEELIHFKNHLILRNKNYLPQDEIEKIFENVIEELEK